MLYLYWRVAYGKLTKPDVAAMPDLDKRELAMLGAIAAVVLWMGVYPESFLAPMRNDVNILLSRIDHAKPGGDAQIAHASVPTPLSAEGEAH